ncbi:MAG: ABC transporter ATP-binding protein [Ilumatobacter sp.]|jgi:general nucleoside transport system ATP-binding protein|uniref:ABC transporter ATP-binding protein n=1 Tax=Ilumatobacter sp. TaxID=1967498 RepID=UPI0039189063
MSATPAVELIGIEKRFPGVIANHDVNITVDPQTIHAIIGENGAGKSTLMKTLYGMHQPEKGTVVVNGLEQHFRSPSDAIDAGIGMVHQHFMLAENFTVLENIILGAEPTNGIRLDMKSARTELARIAKNAGISIDLDAFVSELGVGQRQRVEILKVLFRGAKILILDEPTAVLVPQEVDELFENLRQLVADGATVIFISHKLDEVLAVSDDITVIRAGTTVASVKPAEVTQTGLGELMVGDALPSAEPRTTTISDEVRLEVTSLTVANPVPGVSKPLVSDASFAVRSGEILGVAGVEGNGQYELCQAILGLVESEGTIRLDGNDVTMLSTRQRLETGLSYIPFDRHSEGLMLDAPLWENLLLTRDEEPPFRSGAFVNQKAVRDATLDTIDKFGVRTPDETVPAYALSGGNQQKLLVGRELDSNPSVMIAAHPTRGVDVGAQATIWHHLRAERDDGLAVLLITADLEELIALSDRIIVMFDGLIHAELQPAEATPEILGTYMTGGRPERAA